MKSKLVRRTLFACAALVGVLLVPAGPAASAPASGPQGAEKAALLSQFLVQGYQTGPRTEVVQVPVSVCPGRPDIPAVRVTLALPKGVHPLKATYTVDSATGGKHPVPAGNLRWSMQDGRPTWVLRNVGQDPIVHWNLVVQLPQGMKTFAVTATGTPIGVPNASVQRNTLRLQVHPCSAGCWPPPRNKTS